LTIDTRGTLAQIRQRAIEESEERYLRDKLAQCNGRIDRTALEAGITPRQLHKLMTKYRLRKESFR
jgi:DNA-binding NtrC family response regulator